MISLKLLDLFQDATLPATVGHLTLNAVENEIYELLLLKHWAMRYATNAACTILRVDQIIMAKRAGGPKARPGNGPMDTEDDD